jgi:hypothetical protein
LSGFPELCACFQGVSLQKADDLEAVSTFQEKGKTGFLQPVELTVNWLQIRPFGPYLSSFSTNSYGYSSQTS